MATPTFGGTNGVASLDIGQPGGTRHGAGTHSATISVTIGAVETSRVVTELPEQNVVFADQLGIIGRTITWHYLFHASSESYFNAVLGELEGYKSGKNPETGSTDPTRMHRTELTALGRTFSAVVLADYRLLGKRAKRTDGWYFQQIELVFRELGDAQA